MTDHTPGIRFIPKQARSTKTRDRLIAEGATLYRTVGRDRLTTAEVAAAAGVAIGTFYRYFADRVALLNAVAPDRDTPPLGSELLAELEQKLAEQAAAIEAMYAIVFDPISDYYGEIRVKFDALQAGIGSTEGTR